jgi:hypothetical protein
MITLLAVETNHYYYNYIERLDDGLSPEPGINDAEMLVFLALTIQMGHGVRAKLTDYWSKEDQLYTTFYGNTNKDMAMNMSCRVRGTSFQSHLFMFS